MSSNRPLQSDVRQFAILVLIGAALAPVAPLAGMAELCSMSPCCSIESMACCSIEEPAAPSPALVLTVAPQPAVSNDVHESHTLDVDLLTLAPDPASTVPFAPPPRHILAVLSTLLI